jgi:hypothetical protein
MAVANSQSSSDALKNGFNETPSSMRNEKKLINTKEKRMLKIVR